MFFAWRGYIIPLVAPCGPLWDHVGIHGNMRDQKSCAHAVLLMKNRRERIAMNRKTVFYFLFAAVSILTISGCTDYVGKEKSHPLFSKGGACADSQNYTDAVKAYEEFLMICPRSALTHSKLAVIYFDHLDDPFKALYHFQKTAELSDPNSADVQDIRHFIELSRQKLYEKLKTEYQSDDRELRAIREELEATRKKLQSYVTVEKALRVQNTQMKQRLLEIANERRNASSASAGRVNSGELRRPVTSSSSQASSSRQGAAASSSPSVANRNPGGGGTAVLPVSGDRFHSSSRPVGDSYTVKSGDTLMKIAREVYGSASHYKHILNANKDQLGEDGNKLRIGQVLRLPPLPSTRNATSVQPSAGR